MSASARPRPSLGARLWPASANWRPHRSAVRTSNDVPYVAEGAACQSFDLFLPAQGAANGLPWVMFVHGGLWKRHDRKLLQAASGLYGNVGAAFARAGVGAVVAGYRHQDGRAEDGLEDLLAAWRYVRGHAGEHGLDPERGVIMGHSAGAHLAVTIAAGIAEDVRPAAVIALAGFYDADRFARTFSKKDEARFFQFFAAADGVVDPRWSPERRVDGAPPLFAVVAEQDPESLRAEHAALVAAARSASVPTDSLIVEATGHMGLVLQIGAPHDVITARALAWIEQALATAPGRATR